MTMVCLDAAQLARQCGISVLPPKQDGSKAPDSSKWTRHQSQRATEAEIDAWYSAGRTGVGWVCGKVSGGLEVIDFDDRSIFAEFKKACADSGAGDVLDKVMDGYCEYTPNGTHLAYRCSAIEGSKKMAYRRDGVDDKGCKKYKTLIETKGEGGYIIVAPTHGSVNKKGEYVLQSGSVEKIATITPGERQLLFRVADVFDEGDKPEEWKPKQTKAVSEGRPGDDFGEKTTWEEILQPHGWTRMFGRLGKVSWRRPGKDRDISATTNHNESDLLYVFSSSTSFEPNRGYSKFSAYTLLNHGGDFSAAARDLRLQGFGQEAAPVPVGEVDISEFLVRNGIGAKKHVHPPIEELLRVPGLVGDLADWMNRCAHKKQPVLALGASIVALATVLGKKVQTRSGIRSNIYAVAVGNSGSGKDSARECIKWLYHAIGADRMIGEQLASGTAIETALSSCNPFLLLQDELGQFLGSLKAENTAGHMKAIIPMLLKIYSSSRSSYRCTTFADSKRNAEVPMIDQPSLSMWATTVPWNLYSGLRPEHLSDGFLGRLLFFESNDPDPPTQPTDVDDEVVPEQLVQGFSYWHGFTPPSPSGADLLSPPIIVESTDRAIAIFDGLENMLRDKRRAIRIERGNIGEDSPYMRVRETAIKLALIRACGISEKPEITEADAQWGVDLAWLLTDNFVQKAHANVADNQTEEAYKKIARLVAETGEAGMTKRDITRATKNLKDYDRTGIMRSLVEAGEVCEVQISPKLKKYVSPVSLSVARQINP